MAAIVHCWLLEILHLLRDFQWILNEHSIWICKILFIFITSGIGQRDGGSASDTVMRFLYRMEPGF